MVKWKKHKTFKRQHEHDNLRELAALGDSADVMIKAHRNLTIAFNNLHASACDFAKAYNKAVIEKLEKLNVNNNIENG